MCSGPFYVLLVQQLTFYYGQNQLFSRYKLHNLKYIYTGRERLIQTRLIRSST